MLFRETSCSVKAESTPLAQHDINPLHLCRWCYCSGYGHHDADVVVLTAGILGFYGVPDASSSLCSWWQVAELPVVVPVMFTGQSAGPIDVGGCEWFHFNCTRIAVCVVNIPDVTCQFSFDVSFALVACAVPERFVPALVSVHAFREPRISNVTSFANLRSIGFHELQRNVACTKSGAYSFWTCTEP